MKIKLLFAVSLISLTSFAHNSSENKTVSHKDPLQQQLTQFRQTAKNFGKQLKAELKKGMQQGGPVNAISVCHIKAPQISRKLSHDQMTLARTSLKYRNPKNKPDAWETKVLQRFDQQNKQNPDVKNLEYYEVVTEENIEYLRYMKAIPTADVCLACHGQSLAPAVIAKLDELYPEDKARGYSQGEIRGAFTFKSRLKE